MNDLGTWQERILANKPKPTNADRIRAMTDEELAEWLDQIDGVGRFEFQTQWLDWLKQEANE